MITIFGSTYSVRMPPYYTAWMRHFDFLSLQWDDLIGVPADCLAGSFNEQLLITALLPLGLIAVVFVLHFLRAGFRHAARATVLSEGLLDTAPFALLVTFALVPSVSANIFKAWSCQGFGNTQTETVYYLRKDLSIKCYESDEHARAVNIAIVLMVAWPIVCRSWARTPTSSKQITVIC